MTLTASLHTTRLAIFGSVDPESIGGSDATAHPHNPILDRFRQVDGFSGWWVSDLGEILRGDTQYDTGTIADILDSIGAWDDENDEPTPGHELSPQQISLLSHAEKVITRVRALRLAAGAE
ncbi:hypothetical protein [Leifsonia sp. Leaf264]|uniref:hypothetical protein n=1 Tax=Leifsonia sp. Leaf264 TaxID=1736314 RepID=UPI0006F9F644|nr:hypothetical protein [Leifsonia sp. Leaf264]KQO98336.1 hypothetical protein ASF30_09760 [Leifsonia sp. Leaf264]